MFTTTLQMNFYYLLLSVLTVWRITHLFSKEDGPFNIIFLIRKKAGAGFFGNLLDCFYCLSIWIAFPFGILMGNGLMEIILSWFAISGAACLLEQATIKKDRTPDPEYFED